MIGGGSDGRLARVSLQIVRINDNMYTSPWNTHVTVVTCKYTHTHNTHKHTHTHAHTHTYTHTTTLLIAHLSGIS